MRSVRRRYPAAREMIDAGLAVVLATDFNPGSSPTPSMPMILSLAATHMKMTPAEAITAATINAAYSLNRGDQLGSLEPGKIADFVIHDCDDYRELAYFFGIEHAWKVYCGGDCIESVMNRLVDLIKSTVDDRCLVFYYPRNTGKEVIQKYMSSNHSEVAAA